MKLAPATDKQVLEIMQWFPDRRSCQMWGGPQFRFPFTVSTFLEDTRSRELPSFALLAADDRLLGFGQYYPRVGRCHLGRLVISPLSRGEGLGRWLIGGLVEIGAQRLGVAECSLFVAPENASAIRLYQRLGFVPSAYPEDDPNVASFIYMVASAAGLTGLGQEIRGQSAGN